MNNRLVFRVTGQRFVQVITFNDVMKDQIPNIYYYLFTRYGKNAKGQPIMIKIEEITNEQK